jgi:hypothetical protein
VIWLLLIDAVLLVIGLLAFGVVICANWSVGR